ncbi:MAG: ankyrin repeat domain-containing protein [Rickettsia endosymbiont of Platyusa sonomae]|nr:ankyrin repeat domain-containing protein [Rickettsia endosymbiont of Platyusa sonomae]
MNMPLSERENNKFCDLIEAKEVSAIQEFLATKPNFNMNQSILCNSYRSFLQLALTHSSFDVIKLLVKNSIESPENYRDRRGNTAFHDAILLNQPKILALLIKQYPHCVNTVDDSGNTLIHIATQQKNIDATLELLNTGADYSLLNSQGAAVSFMPLWKDNNQCLLKLTQLYHKLISFTSTNITPKLKQELTTITEEIPSLKNLTMVAIKESTGNMDAAILEIPKKLIIPINNMYPIYLDYNEVAEAQLLGSA